MRYNRYYNTKTITGGKQYILCSELQETTWNDTDGTSGSYRSQYVKLYDTLEKANRDYKSWLKGKWYRDYKKMLLLELDTDTGITRDISYTDDKSNICGLVFKAIRDLYATFAISSRTTPKGITISLSPNSPRFDKVGMGIVLDTIIEKEKHNWTCPVKFMLDKKPFRIVEPQTQELNNDN